MAVIVKQVRSSRIAQTILSVPCLTNFTPVDSYTSVIIEEVRSSLPRAIEHRKKPLLLIDSLTGRSPVYRHHSYAGCYKTVLHSGRYCGDPYNKYMSGDTIFYNWWLPSVEAYPSPTFDILLWNNLMRDKIKSLRCDLSGTIAEIDETVEMLRDFINIVKEVQYCFRHPLSQRCLKWFVPAWKKTFTWKTIPSAILLQNFAINPLVSTVYSAAETLRDPLRSQWRKVKLRMVQESVAAQPNPPGTVRQRLVVKTVAYVEMKSDSKLDSFNIGNPAEWAWERIPFSFVLDWILPVGDYIGRLGALQNVKSIRGTRTYKGTVTFAGTGALNASVSAYFPCRAEKVMHSRDVFTTVDGPTLIGIQPAGIGALKNALSLLAVLRSKS